ncbi:MAG: glycoside hydrolase family 3 N-terminal domain-containing protein [Vicingaceae bacterium]
MLRNFLFGVLILSSLSFQSRQTIHYPYEEKVEFINTSTPWADSLIQVMSLKEKIGQLFNIAAYSNKGEKHTEEVLTAIKEYKVGGLTFFQGGPHRQAKLSNFYQENSNIPLMVAMDAEWGVSMRIDSSMKYPWQMTLGAIQDESLIEEMGKQIGEQCRRLGVHVNFAPVVDVNNNPDNPVIFARSFGENKENVTRKGIAYMKGLQAAKVIACAKHFPGHGDTDTDSHIRLPVVNHSQARIDSLEIYPFRQLVHAGVASIMTAHLNLPQLMKGDKNASSLSPLIVDSILKQELSFEGLIFTDGLNMGGVAKYQESAQIDVQALVAGNDVLLLSQDVPAAIKAIEAAIKKEQLSEDQITASAHKVLKAKEWLGLHEETQVELKHLLQDLNKPEYLYLNRQLVEASLTMLRNEKKRLPVKSLKGKKMISLAFAEKGVAYRAFQEGLNRYARVDTLHFSSLPVAKQKALMDTLLTYDEVFVSVHKSNKHPWVSAEINTEFKNFINILRLKKEVNLCLFANAYALQDFLAAEFVPSLIVSYQNSELAQDLSSQLIFGGVQAKGKLPISVSQNLKSGMGSLSPEPFRLKYTVPEELQLKTRELEAVTEIVEEGIAQKAYPGAQVYIAKAGKVIYHRSFGSHTYKKNRHVKSSDLYDLASVTKIASTLLAIMELDGEGKLSLDDELGKHLRMTRGTDYEHLILRDILAHQAGLAAWIPFYNKTLKKGQLRYDLYSKAPSEKYSVQIAKDLYMIPEYKDTIFYRILNRAEVKKKKEYRYSDVGYYFLKEIVERYRKMPIESYNQKAFYEPLGMHRTTFLPLEKFSLKEITPTENDKVFRKQLIHGYVHDPGAAMLGGVGGHAGLFANANDVGKLMQMYLQDGKYGGAEYLKAEVLEEYTNCQYCEDSIPHDPEENRRGAGFDKPSVHGEPGPTCDCISFESFGHSGFTGTYAWVDPTEDLVYVFLSNRVYPDANNPKLVKLNIRTRIQEKIYEAISNMKYRNSQDKQSTSS